MFLTDADVQKIRRVIEATGDLDDELAEKCGPLIYMKADDDAALKAPIILENRLRSSAALGSFLQGNKHVKIADLINFAFGPNGPLTVNLGAQGGEATGLHELFAGAFNAFRNPAAHGNVATLGVNAKAILGLVNLLLGILDRASNGADAGKTSDQLPDSVESKLKVLASRYDAATGEKLRSFVQSALGLGLRPIANMQYLVGFRANALRSRPNLPNGQKAWIPVFYIEFHDCPNLLFPVNLYQAAVKGFDSEKVKRQLKEIGAKPLGKHQDPMIDVRKLKDQATYGQLINLVKEIREACERSLA